MIFALSLLDEVISVERNLTPESRDPDLLVIDSYPEKDPDPPGDPDLFDNFLPNFFYQSLKIT